MVDDPQKMLEDLASISDEMGGDPGRSRWFAVERRLGLGELKLGHLTDVGARARSEDPQQALWGERWIRGARCHDDARWLSQISTRLRTRI